MQKLIDTPYYNKAFQELNYDFGDFYLFETFVVGEIKEGIAYNWKDHAKHVVTEISNLYEDNGKNIVYISNRINNYAVVPSDWIHFFKYNKTLKGYAVVSHGKQNCVLEKLFWRSKMKCFNELSNSIKWAQELNIQSEKDRLSA